MHARPTRRAVLLLPLLLAACAGGEPAPAQSFRPLDFSYLPQLRLNVARVEVVQRFVPSEVPPSVLQFDPVSPAGALRRMGRERLKAFGSAGRAVFSVNNASLVQQGDVITGTFSVGLEIYTSNNTRAGFAEATVSRQRVGPVHDMAADLYALTRQMMNQMNVELEYQIRRSLHDWLVAPGASAAPVRAEPLGMPGAPQPLAPQPLAPQSLAPQPLAPQQVPPAPLGAPSALPAPVPYK